MDFNKLTVGDKVVAGSGIALFVFWLFPWFKLDFFGRTYSQKGTHFFFTGTVPMLIGLVMLAWIVATKLAEVDLPELPIPQGLLILGLGALAALLVILRLLIGGDDEGTDVLDRAFGIFLATIAAIGLAVGGFLKFQEEGGELPNKKSGGSGNGPATPF